MPSMSHPRLKKRNNFFSARIFFTQLLLNHNCRSRVRRNEFNIRERKNKLGHKVFALKNGIQFCLEKEGGCIAKAGIIRSYIDLSLIHI